MIHARADYNARIQDSAGLIPDDEPVLLIRGQDLAAVAAGEAWLTEARRLGTDDATVAAVERHLDRVRHWQDHHGGKVPDAPAEAIA